MSRLIAKTRKPIFWILAVALAAALFLYRDFGLTWDEPLFYQYADALSYAYTPANWFSGHFDLSQSYGPSAYDHKTRGPGYLVIARLPARALVAAGMDVPSAWHLVNALTFLLGVYFVYKLSLWLAGEWPAAVASSLFATQPLLWGHAFINPKDMPFMVLFSGAVWLGIRMADASMKSSEGRWSKGLGGLLLPGIVLGLATSNRVLGPLAGLLIGFYWLVREPRLRTLLQIAAYGIIAVVTTLATWPYLWEGPRRFLEVFGFMANNPTVLPVLFGSEVYRASDMPRRYLPFYMAVTLTEPVWLMVAAGSLASLTRAGVDRQRAWRLIVLLAWLLIPLAYVLVAGPSIYDGMRHFLFLLPPAFALVAAGSDILLSLLKPRVLRLILGLALLFPGFLGIAKLHPYEYAYYNSFVGGTGGAFRKYETDYWLTCYRESMVRLGEMVEPPARVFVHREASVAAPYARQGFQVLEERDHRSEIASGDYVLINTRTNEDLHDWRDAPVVLSIGRDGAVFCVVKRIP